VCIGKYAKIPRIFSKELTLLISKMLKVEPTERYSCDELLDMSVIKRKAEEIGLDDNVENVITDGIQLERTDKMWLPAPSYTSP